MSFSRLSLLFVCFIHAEASATTGTRRPRVNMATGQERLIPLAELQTFRAKESDVKMSRQRDVAAAFTFRSFLSAASSSASSSLFHFFLRLH